MTENDINRIYSSLTRIENALFIGGDSYMERLTKVEENLNGLIESGKEQSNQIGNLTKSVSKLEKMMEKHIGDRKSHNFISQIMRDPKTAGFCFGSMLVIFLIATNFPSVFEFFKKLFGF